MLFQWLVDPHFSRLTPAAGAPAPARWIGTAGAISNAHIKGLQGLTLIIRRLYVH